MITDAMIDIINPPKLAATKKYSDEMMFPKINIGKKNIEYMPIKINIDPTDTFINRNLIYV